MIINERYQTFMNMAVRGNTRALDRLEQKALADFVPIIRKDTQHFIKVLMKILQPERILEIGTGVGFSALLMSEYGPGDSRITTIENYEKRIAEAKVNIKAAGKEGQIKLLEGDAKDHLKDLSGPYDFIFMDAAKGQYIHFLPELLRLLREGGVLLTDNIFQDGEIIESRFAVERRNRTIHARMREYLKAIKENKALETTILPIGDGLALSTKGREELVSYE